eukprot:TRINITY_DN2238_c0_g1_i2.p1 TRINITY_DN2238_c0_g1~~TRINITY_DN2238_c0_g1_i2.p1  ORF type:complete len:256 (-),score=32.67 TRINITY_DN2238_c0_g1_i2:257-1024(-)
MYRGALDCFTKTVRGEGIQGLYKGVASPIAGQMFHRAILLTTYGQAKISLGATNEESLSRFFWAGCVTGAVASFTEGPIDFFKSQVQVQVIRQAANPGLPVEYAGVWDCARKIVGKRGIAGAYQGLGATLVRNIPANGVYFISYEWCRRYFAGPAGDVSRLPQWQVLLSGAAGGTMYWLATYPTDVVKSVMQTDAIQPTARRYRSWGHAVSVLWQEGGAKRFWKGFTPCLARSPIANGVMFVVFETVHRALDARF